MVRHARLVRTGPAEEGPLVHHQLAQAECLGIGRAEPATRAAAHEDEVVVRALVPMDVLQRLVDLAELGTVDEGLPFGHGQVGVAQVHVVILRQMHCGWAIDAAGVNASK